MTAGNKHIEYAVVQEMRYAGEDPGNPIYFAVAYMRAVRLITWYLGSLADEIKEQTGVDMRKGT